MERIEESASALSTERDIVPSVVGSSHNLQVDVSLPQNLLLSPRDSSSNLVQENQRTQHQVSGLLIHSQSKLP